jgi:hypothetical protein
MHDLLYEWDMQPTTWVYLSSLIMIAVYFKFRRFWSVRNLDLAGLIALAPGLLLVSHGREQLGYIWLFCVGGFFLIRLLIDPLMVRRPMLEPNLTAGGLTFMGCALLFFLMCNVVTGKPTESDLRGANWVDQMFSRQAGPEVSDFMAEHGPGYPLFYVFGHVAGKELRPVDATKRLDLHWYETRITSILANLAIVIGMVLIGYRHFDNVHTGVAVASLYLLLPYTSRMTPHVDNLIPLDHVIPAALLVWAVEAYRRPVLSGFLLGLAAGVVYYPLYLLPLWCGFYWRRGVVRFSLGVLMALLLLVGLLVFTSPSLGAFWIYLRQMFGAMIIPTEQLTGFWSFYRAEAVFRIPVIAAFVALCGSMALWPAQKNLGTLLSLSAAVMLGLQFWKGHEGGLYMAWYLPLLILTIFRPNLEDRVALSALSEGWIRWRRTPA